MTADSSGVGQHANAPPAEDNDDFVWDEWLEEISQDTRSQYIDDKKALDEIKLYWSQVDMCLDPLDCTFVMHQPLEDSQHHVYVNRYYDRHSEYPARAEPRLHQKAEKTGRRCDGRKTGGLESETKRSLARFGRAFGA